VPTVSSTYTTSAASLLYFAVAWPQYEGSLDQFESLARPALLSRLQDMHHFGSSIMRVFGKFSSSSLRIQLQCSMKKKVLVPVSQATVCVLPIAATEVHSYQAEDHRHTRQGK
jgi:hypothetical protein